MTIMHRLIKAFLWVLTLICVGCASSQKPAEPQQSAKRCRMEMRVGSRIPEEVCTTTDEEALRFEVEKRKFDRGVHKTGSTRTE